MLLFLDKKLLDSMVYNFFHKISWGSGVNNERPLDIAEELYTPVIKKIKK